jgi:hypothetical protein
MRRQSLRDERGQASPEWLGVVLVVCIAFAAMVAAGVHVPGAGLAGALVERFVCAVDLGEGCGGEPTALTLAYGPEMAGLVAELVPTLEYEEGMLALPVDWRSCREDACANGPSSGETTESQRGEPVTLFSHVVNCLNPAAPTPAEAECEGDAAGNLYIQFWAYYPDSATTPFDGEAFGRAGQHPDDWESFQVRIGPDGIEERASSHHGYNGESGDPVNDTGWLPGKSAWTTASGRYGISSKSHAGHVGTWHGRPHRWTQSEDVRVVPLETMEDQWGEYVGSEKHAPAWLKDVYLDPEATGTAG